MISGASTPQDRFRVAVWQRPWRSQAVLVSPTSSGFEQRVAVTQAANVGRLAAPLGPGFEGRIDRSATLLVELFDGEAASVSRLHLLNGANALAVKAANGVWEIVQFETAQEVAPGLWRLGRLLRGQLGTSDAMALGAAAGSSVVMLDDAVAAAGLKASEIGLQLNWRIGPADEALGARYSADISTTGGLRALLPLSPVHLRCRVGGTGRHFSWIRRGRVDADSWEAADIPLGEENERYRIDISGDAGPVRRSTVVTSPEWTYGPASYAADFPVAPSNLIAVVRQIGTGGREGLPARREFHVS